MQPNHEIKSQEDLLSHFGSSKQLEILDLEQMEKLLKMNVSPEIWEDASNRNLLSFNQEFVQRTQRQGFFSRGIKRIFLISFLTNLIELNLSGNNISDISSISKLKNLKKLYLESNCIEDISALQSLPDLTHLQLYSNRLTSYTLVLPNLVYLSLGNNKLQDKSGLQHSPKLERLYLSGTETTDLRSIPHQLFGLKVIQLSFNNILEISHLSNFVGMQILDLGINQQLQNIEPLKFCTEITELCIRDSNVADIWPLQFLKNLKTLNINNTKVVDLHPLQYLYQLEQIYASNSCIIDVSPLSKLTQLKELNFRNNKITNADSLKHHDNFSEYDFSDQEVPTTDELKFYNRILKVHSTQKQTKKIMNENKNQQFRTSLTQKKNYVSTMLNNQIQTMNKQVEMLIQLVQNSISHLD
ncbi:leucine-rich_repeat domain-containing protein [Hexamita inflata]|uniref:Leucine-rich repeat domain-containing protein n=1 Tax=Hexamita inflata TaxID=28002 RepID=A0AA86N6M0_9EUKA|nr:leucine-rich repeat domain-containing protein [Hexamita inflata]